MVGWLSSGTGSSVMVTTLEMSVMSVNTKNQWCQRQGSNPVVVFYFHQWLYNPGLGTHTIAGHYKSLRFSLDSMKSTITSSSF